MEEAVKLFCNWGAYVLGSNIKEMIKVAKMFNNHLKGVCNAMVESFSNAMAERLNGKIQESQFTNRLKGDSLVKGLKPSRTDRCHPFPI